MFASISPAMNQIIQKQRIAEIGSLTSHMLIQFDLQVNDRHLELANEVETINQHKDVLRTVVSHV